MTSIFEWIKTNRSMLISVFIVVLVGQGVARLVESSMRRSAVTRNLQQAETELRGKLPMQVDAATKLVDVRVVDMGMVYVQTLDSAYGPFDVADLQKTVTQRVCASIMRESIGRGVHYTYEYFTEKNERVGSFRIDNCAGLPTATPA